MTELTFYEFFAGGGMARLGLGAGWKCLFANDICPKKAAAYRENFPPADELLVEDVAKVSPDMLPGQSALAWASFPCQDLSLAGDRRGLSGERSGTFWPFMRLMTGLAGQNRAPKLIVLENVVGAITSNGGRDLQAILRGLASLGYAAGPLVIDASLFVPQSRPRLFIVAAREPVCVPAPLKAAGPNPIWHPKAIGTAFDKLPDDLRSAWMWWDMPAPPESRICLADLIESEPAGVKWHSREETERLLGMMSPANLAKVDREQKARRSVGAIYKRTRPHGEAGEKMQRAEVRFDGIGGCLRTPAGGSSRQTIIVVERDSIRTRLLSTREAARLMGVPDSYILPLRYNDAYHLMGDGVAVPAVSFLEANLLSPILRSNRRMERVA